MYAWFDGAVELPSKPYIMGKLLDFSLSCFPCLSTLSDRTSSVINLTDVHISVSTRGDAEEGVNVVHHAGTREPDTGHVRGGGSTGGGGGDPGSV